MARADASTCSCVTSRAQQFQEFQPIGGVSEMASPTTIFRSRSLLPSAFSAFSRTTYSPAFFTRPVMRPVRESSFSPLGKPSAEKVMGRAPVAATVKRNSDPGRTPKIRAPLMRGVSAGAGVRIRADRSGVSERAKPISV